MVFMSNITTNHAVTYTKKHKTIQVSVKFTEIIIYHLRHILSKKKSTKKKK